VTGAGAGVVVGSVVIRPESGRSMIVPAFGFGGGCGAGWAVCARALPAKRTAVRQSEKVRFIVCLVRR